MSDIFREVDEALQKEKMERIWREYGPILILSVVVLVVSTAAITGWRAWEHNRNEKQTALLIEAMSAADPAAALESAAGETSGARKAVALMSAAAAQSQQGDFAAAAANYDAVRTDRSAPAMFRDLATILYVRAQGLAQQPDIDYQALLSTVSPVAKSRTGTFRYQARLETALLQGEGLKDYDAALKTLATINEDEAPASLVEQARALEHVYGFEAAAQQQAPEAAGEEQEDQEDSAS